MNPDMTPNGMLLDVSILSLRVADLFFSKISKNLDIISMLRSYDTNLVSAQVEQRILII